MAVTTTTKRAPKAKRIYTAADVAKHASKASCWVIVGKTVYDVTAFVGDHPGGDDLILDWAGKDIKAVMADPAEHTHSDSAYELLDEYAIGVLGTGELLVDENVEIDESFEPENTDSSEDYRKNAFLDLDRPLIMQVWHSNWSKDYYLQQVHQPRHLPQPARLFGPWYLEMFTRTTWWVVPLVWGPITLWLLAQSYLRQTTPGSVYYTDAPTATALTLACFLFGNFFWTFIEYFMHRFLFHIDDLLPDHQAALLLHFLLHGIHHYLPMDRLRLVMPPILFAALSAPFLKLAHALFPDPYAKGVIAGSYAMYIVYDCMHYALHHTRMPEYMKQMKVYHLQHHWKNYDLGFGVTSKLWDVIFSTQLPYSKS